MLLEVLRMPPSCWDENELDRRQRHARYIEAADLIEALLEAKGAPLEIAYYRPKEANSE